MNKSKKIMAGVGIGLALCAGAGMLTGCTDINLSQSQVDKIVTVVDNSDQFMKDSMDLLNKQNKKLDKSEAYDLLRLAEVRAQLQLNDMMENIRITITDSLSDNWQVADVVMYDSTHYAVLQKSSEWGEDYTLEYSYTKEVDGAQKDYMRTYKSAKFDNKNLPVENSDPELIEEEYKLGYSMPGQFASLFEITSERGYNVKEEDVCKVETLENGNYLIYAISVVEGETNTLKHHFEIELTEDAEFVRLNCSSAAFDESGNMSGKTSAMNFAFEKGVVNKDAMKELIAVADAFAEASTNA